MADYTQTELLAGFLAASCLVLLYCWYVKNQNMDSFVRIDRHTGAIMRNGFAARDFNQKYYGAPHSSGFRNNPLPYRRKYVRSGFEGFGDSGKVATLNELEQAGNLSTSTAASKALAGSQPTNSKWMVDMGIPIDQRVATAEDVDANLLVWGNEELNRDVAAEISDCDKLAPASLGGELLRKTDYSSEYASVPLLQEDLDIPYGQAKGYAN